ncbi:hypothetical protein DMUE_2474 [Dictyocoela muelleri]|nr:hypothetical protein DMUE_2474 [Dictyocoela muelleri]
MFLSLFFSVLKLFFYGFLSFIFCILTGLVIWRYVRESDEMKRKERYFYSNLLRGDHLFCDINDIPKVKINDWMADEDEDLLYDTIMKKNSGGIIKMSNTRDMKKITTIFKNLTKDKYDYQPLLGKIIDFIVEEIFGFHIEMWPIGMFPRLQKILLSFFLTTEEISFGFGYLKKPKLEDRITYSGKQMEIKLPFVFSDFDDYYENEVTEKSIAIGEIKENPAKFTKDENKSEYQDENGGKLKNEDHDKISDKNSTIYKRELNFE